MTLVQVLVNEITVHVACDFRLTDPFTGKIVQNDAHKLVKVTTPSISALIGVSGVGSLDTKPIGQWIADAVPSFGDNVSLEEILAALRRAESPLSRIQSPQLRRHTFVVTAFIGSQSVVALVSNFEIFVKGRIQRSPLAQPGLTVSRIKPKTASLFITGAANAVTDAERERLVLSLRAGISDAEIQEELSQVNEAASGRTDTISAGCYAATLHATGTGSSRPFLTKEQRGDFIPPEFNRMMQQFGFKLNPKIGPDGQPMPIRMVGSSSASSGATPEYFREQFKLRPDSSELWNNYGSFLASRRHFRAAIEAFQRAVTLDESNVTALANLAKQMWLQQDDPAAAERLYGKAVEKSQTAPSWIVSDFAVLYDEGLSDPQRAGELHERAAQDKNFPLALARQALFIFKSQTDPEQASMLLQEALDRQPDNAQILRLAAQADWFYRNNPEGARTKLHKACSLDPNDVTVLRMAADVSLTMGDATSAAYYYRKAIKRGESSGQVRGNYGLALLMENKVEGALRQLSQAARSNPDDLAVKTNLAAALWVCRRPDEAVALMRTILDASPPQQIELEVVAMLHVAGQYPGNEAVPRMEALIGMGVRADGNTVRSMVLRGSRNERNRGFRLAKMIEGKIPFSPES